MQSIILSLFFLLCATARAEQVSIALLATTDLHGNLYPYDYYTGRPAARGLARIATLVRQARTENPHTLLVDCGDTIQGSPLEYVYQTFVQTGRAPLNLSWPDGLPAADPMMLAMNRLGYDAMAVGNHEFNFGLKNLHKARSDAKFPWLSANVTSGRNNPFEPYVVRTIAGVKIAIVGITTPAVPSWEKPENLGDFRFEHPVAALKRILPILRQRENPDLVVVAAHSGLGRDLATGSAVIADSGADVVYRIATEIPGIDAIVFGHSHQELAEHRLGNVLLAQPRNWGMSLARMEFTLERETGGRWSVREKKSGVMRVTAETAADPEILEIARPYHEMAERYLNTNVAESAAALDGRLGRVEDHALVDLIHAVQLHYAQADVSFASMFQPRVQVPKGSVTVRQIAGLYVYENHLYAVEGTGRMVKEALENSARYFLSCQGDGCAQAPLINPKVFGFNFDTAQGVSYEVDLTRPEGSRIVNLRYKGAPLAPERKLRIAINNYRAAGSAGFSMFTGAKILWRSAEDIRDLMIRYYTGKQLALTPDDNWRIVPDQARQNLARQALAEPVRLQ
jgi:2',3'-cyclic-nucleotide 2'-phosphodiesterase / 3'-nucleotidase